MAARVLLARGGLLRPAAQSGFLPGLRTVTSSSHRAREDSWLKSLFVRKVDPRKDAHSNLLAKKETSSLYKLQFHNVKPECLDAYNKICQEVLPKIHEGKQYPCTLVGTWNTWYGEQDQAVHLWRSSCTIQSHSFRKWSPGTMIEWGNYWARAIRFRQDSNEAVGGFFSQIGQLYMVHHLWAYKDLQTREDIRNAAWHKHGWEELVYYPALTEVMNKLKENQEFVNFRKARSDMLLSRKNQLLLEFSFWNEPVPRPGPNIYELRSYQLQPVRHM